jgi:hypothetical protein
MSIMQTTEREENAILRQSLRERDEEIDRLLARQTTLVSLLQSALPTGQLVKLTPNGVTIEAASS